MTLHANWLERYWINGSNVELMVSTHVPGTGKETFSGMFELQSSFQKKRKEFAFFSWGCLETVGHHWLGYNKKLQFKIGCV